MPNTRAGIRRSASRSSVYGITEDNNATPRPAHRTHGSSSAVPVGVADSGTALLQPWVLFAGLGVALLSSVIPYTLDLEALRRMPARVFGILMSLEPAMAAMVGLIVLSESLHWSQWIAVLCVVIASAGATRSAAPTRDEVGALS